MTEPQIINFSDIGARDCFLDDLVAQSRQCLRHAQANILKKNPSDPLYDWGRRTGNFPLMCNFAQEMIVRNFELNGILAKPFITEAIEQSPFSHCAAVMPHRLGDRQDIAHVVIDITYTQFELPANLYPEFGLKAHFARRAPPLTLQRTAEGRGLFEQLKNKGYFDVEEETAKLYLESLIPARVLAGKQAKQYLIHPAYHPGNMAHGEQRLREQDALGMTFRI